ncbi:hypothetical protein LGT39_13955 [Demequina sp. TTPB684]|uniref:hypothetical protein n=1 Tax=unclassified Demequina TaxID=2620311 RepID=UPI001CF30FDE|nr:MULTISPECIES: hypothetical protein [unclassified Demequina]MCB2413951.1 hypothetical protein [Demequina sp. TTPB684]UPU88696.1 hypothetical protein LGT36_001875 [Demequina sp. TMPB413]
MSDAREAFQNLQSIAGLGFDGTTLHTDLDAVERRIARHRTGRAVVSSFVALAVLAGATYGASTMSMWGDSAPVAPPSEATSQPTSSPTQRAAACLAAQVVSGKPVGDLGGLMGWFNSSPDAPCGEWPDQILDHPDTVLINTADNTMVEAYYRTNIDALGVYARLGEDFAVPDPDPSWPADSLILIDARTKEVLEITALADLGAAPGSPEIAMSVFGEPYPPGFYAPELVDLVPGGQGGAYISETDTTYIFGLLRPDPDTGDAVEVPVAFAKGDILVSAATHWQCAWIAEFVGASQVDNPERVATAAAQLQRFPDLEVIQKYNPQMGESDRDILIPRIVGGDVDYAERWLNGTCGMGE